MGEYVICECVLGVINLLALNVIGSTAQKTHFHCFRMMSIAKVILIFVYLTEYSLISGASCFHFLFFFQWLIILSVVSPPQHMCIESMCTDYEQSNNLCDLYTLSSDQVQDHLTTCITDTQPKTPFPKVNTFCQFHIWLPDLTNQAPPRTNIPITTGNICECLGKGLNIIAGPDLGIRVRWFQKDKHS